MTRCFSWVALSVCLTGCVGGHLERDRIDAGRAIALTDRDVRKACAEQALKLLDGLPDEGFRKFRQLRLPDHPPLQRFPRLTAPAFVTRCERNEKWYVPVRFDAATGETLGATPALRRGTEGYAFDPRRVSFDGAYPKDALAFWLEPTGADRPEPKEDTRKPRRLIRIHPEQVLAGRDLDLRIEVENERGAAVVLELDGQPAGFYWLRIVPRFAECKGCTGLLRSIADGDLSGILAELRGRETLFATGRSPEIDGKRLAELFGCQSAWWRSGLNDCEHPYKHFWPEMREATKRAKRSGKRNERKLVAALRDLYEGEFSPAGVLLDDGAGDPFSFAIGADTQNSTDMSAFQRFLQVIEEGAEEPQPSMRKEWTRTDHRVLRYEPAWENTAKAVRDELKMHGSRIHFVLIAGDLGDARAGSDLGRMALNAVGLYPPIPTYKTEYPTMVREIRRLPVPLVAVPGNHDGMVGYPGLVNRLIALGGRAFDRANDYVPVLMKPPWPERWPWSRVPDVPRYDGLAEWVYALGPTSYVFNFRGQTFAGVNSFRLTQRERSGVGSVVFNWGGGVTDADVKSLEERIDTLSKSTQRGHTFLYMHHDPRAATPLKKTLEVDRFGVYDEIENRFSAYTFGHFGLGHSPAWDLYLPVLTPFTHHTARLIDDWLSGRGRAQEEWMRRSYSLPWEADVEEYASQHGARRLVGSISDRLAPDIWGGGISHIFFGHNDVPLGPDEWAHTNAGRHVFIELPQGEWLEGREWHVHLDQLPYLPYAKIPLAAIFKVRNDEPPDWAKALQPQQGNAYVVRLDDVANPGGVHGFHLVTVVPRACATPPCGAGVHIKWFALPTKREQ